MKGAIKQHYEEMQGPLFLKLEPYQRQKAKISQPLLQLVDFISVFCKFSNFSCTQLRDTGVKTNLWSLDV